MLFLSVPLAQCVGGIAGDFCEIAKPDLYATPEVAEYMARNDPEHVRQDLAENEYGKENCPDPWWTGA